MFLAAARLPARLRARASAKAASYTSLNGASKKHARASLGASFGAVRTLRQRRGPPPPAPPGRKAPPPPRDPWQEVPDPNGSRLTYWWNPETGATTRLGAARPAAGDDGAPRRFEPQPQQQGLGSVLAEGMAFGAGNSIARHAVGSLFGVDASRPGKGLFGDEPGAPPGAPPSGPASGEDPYEWGDGSSEDQYEWGDGGFEDTSGDGGDDGDWF